MGALGKLTFLPLVCIYDPVVLALGCECFSGDCLGIVSYASGKGEMKNTLKDTHSGSIRHQPCVALGDWQCPGLLRNGSQSSMGWVLTGLLSHCD